MGMLPYTFAPEESSPQKVEYQARCLSACERIFVTAQKFSMVSWIVMLHPPKPSKPSAAPIAASLPGLAVFRHGLMQIPGSR